MEKKIINKILTVDKDYLKEKLDDLPEDVKHLIENIEPSYLEDLENPFKTLNELLLVINKILEFYKEKLEEEPFTEEQARMINQTVGRLEATLEQICCKNNDYNVSKVSDMYDVVRFDALHPSYNSDELLGMQKVAYEKAKALSRFVQPMEYGTTW